MYQRDYKDIVAGALLSLTGAGMVWYASRTLDFGTISRMGPGMFPTSVGALLFVFGVLIALPAFFRSGTHEQIEWRALFPVLISVAVFAALVRTFGMVPAIVSQVAISTLAERRFRPLALLGLCTLLPLTAYLIFTVGLGLPLTMLRWPFK